MLTGTKRKLVEAEAARIARWFGESDCGPVFHDLAGRALPVTDRQRDQWQAHAARQVERYVERLDRTPVETVLIAFLLASAGCSASALLGPHVPMLEGPVPALAAMPALLWPGLVALQFRHAQRRFRRDIGYRLSLRTPLPEAQAVAARRYNMFAYAQTIGAVALLGIGAVAAWRDDPTFGWRAMLALGAALWLLYFASRRVDAVHRRKRW